MNFAEKERIVFSRTVRSIFPAAKAASRAYKKCGKKNRALKKTRFFCKFILDRINEFNKSSLNAYSYICLLYTSTSRRSGLRSTCLFQRLPRIRSGCRLSASCPTISARLSARRSPNRWRESSAKSPAGWCCASVFVSSWRSSVCCSNCWRKR